MCSLLYYATLQFFIVMSSSTQQLLLFLHIFLSMFAKQLFLFCQISPLLCFADDEIVQVHTLYGIWADDQELVRNLTSLVAAPILPSLLFSSLLFSSLLCYDALKLQVHDQMMIDIFLRPLLLLLLIFLIYCFFIGLLWFIDLLDFLYLLTYLKHTFLHLLEQSTVFYWWAGVSSELFLHLLVIT